MTIPQGYIKQGNNINNLSIYVLLPKKMSDEDELPSTKLPFKNVIRQKSVYVSRILFYGHQKSAAVLCSKECCVDTMHVLILSSIFKL